MDHRSIYISSAEPRSGSLLVAIGIMEMLKGRYKNVAFFRPILPDNIGGRESNITFMLEHFKLNMSYEECCGFTISEYTEAYAHDQEEKLHTALMSKIKKLYETHDFILIEGYPRSIFSFSFDFDLNLQIARNLDTAYISVLRGKEKSVDEILNEIQIVTEAVETEGCTNLATVVNRCDEETLETLKSHLKRTHTEEQIYLLPEIKEIDTPTLGQVVEILNAKQVLGTTEQLQRLVYGNKIAAMGVENYLSRINNGDVIIVPGDRIDIVLASLLSYYGKNHANIVGLILSGGIPLSDTIIDLLKDFTEITIPTFSVETDSYHTAILLNQTKATLTVESTHKITLIKGMFDAAVDKKKISHRFRSTGNEVLTPVMFQYQLFEQAKSKRQTIVLPESQDERILRATEILINRDVVNVILLGNPDEIELQSQQLGVDISNAQIIDPKNKTLQEKFATIFYEMRKHKGLEFNVAKDAMTHISYFATMMVHTGMADGMVSGATHTTADTIRPALQIIKTKPDISVVSSIFFMCLDTKVLIYGDCAVNMDPSAEELAQIAISSAETAQQFGIEPRVALLSYSTGSSGSGPEVEKVRKATLLAQAQRPDILIEGPIQYDAAIDKRVARTKLPDSKVAGRATVFVFPDLNTGNNTYKAVQRSTGALAIGPILQGLRLPINDLSRGCLVDDIVNTVIITAIQAQKEHIS